MIIKALQSVKRYGFREFLARTRGRLFWLWHKYVLKSRYVTRQVYEYKMILDLADPGISTVLAKGILREKDQVYVIRREIGPGAVVLDIGANIGYYALLEASVVGATGTVYAVEPVPRNYELLKRNVALNGFDHIIETFPIAISDTDKIEKFFISSHSNLGSFFNMDYATGARLDTMKDDPILVKTLDIAGFVKDKRRIDIVRMDIEGGEVEVFNGISKIIDPGTFMPNILFETHRSRYHAEKHDIRRPLRALFGKGYYVKTLISNEDNAKWHDRGYKPDRVIRTDGVRRGLYSNIREVDAIEIISRLGGVRAVLLAHRNGSAACPPATLSSSMTGHLPEKEGHSGLPSPRNFKEWYEGRLRNTKTVTASLGEMGVFRGLADILGMEEWIVRQAFSREFHKKLTGKPFSFWATLLSIALTYGYWGYLLLRSFRKLRTAGAQDAEYIFEEWSPGVYENFGYRWFAERAAITDYVVVCTVGVGKGSGAHRHPPRNVFCLVENHRSYRAGAVTKALYWGLRNGYKVFKAQRRLQQDILSGLRAVLSAYFIYDNLFKTVRAKYFLTGQEDGISPMAYGLFKANGGKTFCVVQKALATLGAHAAYTAGDALVTWGDHSSWVYRSNGAQYKRYVPLGSIRLHRYLSENPAPAGKEYDICCSGVYFLYEDYRVRKDCAEILMRHLARLSLERPDLRIAYCQHGLSKIREYTEKMYMDDLVPDHRVLFPMEETYSVAVRSKLVVSVCSSVLFESAAAGAAILIFDYTENSAFFNNGAGMQLPAVTDPSYETFKETVLRRLASIPTEREKESCVSMGLAPLRHNYADDLKAVFLDREI